MVTEYIADDAPKDYGKGRSCKKCGETVMRYTVPYYGNLILCGRCVKACSDSGLSPYRFAGVTGPKRVTRYDLPELEAVRENRGWSRHHLAKQTECAFETVKKIELGLMQASTKMAGRLARALEVSVGELRGER